MSYLLDKKIREKKFFKITFGVIVLFVLIYFRAGIWGGLSYASHGIFRPVLVLGNGLGEKMSNLSAYFASKNSLQEENENLKSQILENQADRANYDSVVAENEDLKEILGRLPAQAGKSENVPLILSAILSKPNRSPYDTIIIDAGETQGIKVGDIAFAFGNVPIGRIAEVYASSSKVILFSSSGEKTQTIMSGRPARAGGDVFLEIVGRGGGNFEMILPRDFILQKGEQVIMPGLYPYILAVVETIISDPRNPVTKVLLSSPVNIQELKFVEVEKI
ncbi:MAG: hypothetical protein UW07_C0031G0003 [Candidatus Nomurabacteria bacterium GW2011_GWF2_43_8]|uniref:Rod shape-determining protein MreC beta-barrel core domain-containing protein n=3 Tax=Candidatus Nomuraibacteriota TaxID=1752729 RepID=A0A0G1HT55_9BACT|nr:MAG: hypothetical protein UV76_C0006G0025 [Candidatus Nomurabacteria bacterium GW2011_GWA2_43_15]KKT19971.1 MAG: hypothetical protein UW02_C0003G0023 [Candidatus Nomurabacteria bacterium GW2011_GWB1_43_7]KKT22742.1 MAG: hypothetical protein UW07_C0031G0003 [Candidatus Nomurabacteria bacterium GW2011_GWF2_43_8]